MLTPYRRDVRVRLRQAEPFPQAALLPGLCEVIAESFARVLAADPLLHLKMVSFRRPLVPFAVVSVSASASGSYKTFSTLCKNLGLLVENPRNGQGSTTSSTAHPSCPRPPLTPRNNTQTPCLVRLPLELPRGHHQQHVGGDEAVEQVNHEARVVLVPQLRARHGELRRVRLRYFGIRFGGIFTCVFRVTSACGGGGSEQALEGTQIMSRVARHAYIWRIPRGGDADPSSAWS